VVSAIGAASAPRFLGDVHRLDQGAGVFRIWVSIPVEHGEWCVRTSASARRGDPGQRRVGSNPVCSRSWNLRCVQSRRRLNRANITQQVEFGGPVHSLDIRLKSYMSTCRSD
jgi:hypothetical protein